jgi:hypothetical protein
MYHRGNNGLFLLSRIAEFACTAPVQRSILFDACPKEALAHENGMIKTYNAVCGCKAVCLHARFGTFFPEVITYNR